MLGSPHGWPESLSSYVATKRKTFDREINDLYASPIIASGIRNCDPGFASSDAEVREILRAQFPPRTSDITTEEFLRTAKDALALAGTEARVPCTLLILDELQAYVGDSHGRSVVVTEVVEAVSKQLDSRVIVVGAGQSALTDVLLLQKLMDRCTIRVPLSDIDVEAVIRKVVLQKNARLKVNTRAVTSATLFAPSSSKRTIACERNSRPREGLPSQQSRSARHVQPALQGVRTSGSAIESGRPKRRKQRSHAMKSFILAFALASGAWLSGGATADAADVHFVRGGRHGHHHGHHHRHHHHRHHGHHHGFHHGHYFHHGHHGHFYGGYPFYGGTYYRSPYYSPYRWQTPYYGFRLYGPTFSFGYYGY